MTINSNPIIIGLTGPLGSGCSTLANQIVSCKKKEYNRLIKIENEGNNSDLEKISTLLDNSKKTNDYLKSTEYNKKLYEKLEYREILKNVTNKYKKFEKLSFSKMIIKIIIDHVRKNDSNYLKWKNREENLLKDIFKNYENRTNNGIKKEDIVQIKRHIKDIENSKNNYKKLLKLHQNKSFLQYCGDNIRNTGNPFQYEEYFSSINNTNLTKIAEKIAEEITPEKASCYIIDAFRNPAEIEYFREKYKNFYLIAISASEDERRTRLKFPPTLENEDDQKDHFEKINLKDWGEEIENENLHVQHVYHFMLLADIIISNNLHSTKYNHVLIKAFFRYWALINHPGCIHPTKDETLMNLALSISMRSTCISKQVGAVITDENGSIIGMGWNDVPNGSIGCGLRYIKDYSDKKNVSSKNL